MTHWDERFFGLALQAREWVKGVGGVGAVAVSPDRRRNSIGYSGLPAGMQDTPERMSDLKLKDQFMVHAELNAIINARCSLRGWTLYSTKCPCNKCALAIVQAGIIRVVSPLPDGKSRWAPNQQLALDIFKEVGIEHEAYNGN